MIINADGLILGRLASNIAKRLLENDEEIIVVNAERAIISGSKVRIFKEYDAQVKRGTKEKGPYYPKRSDQMLKRTVRGMLSYKRKRGRDAYSRLKVYIGTPAEMQSEPLETVENAKMSRLSTIKYIRLGNLSKKLGAN